MLFSRQQLETAFMYYGLYFNKILLVNFTDNTFSPIKVSDKEWRNIPKNVSFTDWVYMFMAGENYKSNESMLASYNLLDFTDIEFMKCVTHPLVVNYQKKIDGDWHDVQTELYPTNDGCAYLFVRDLTEISEGIAFEEEEGDG